MFEQWEDHNLSTLEWQVNNGSDWSAVLLMEWIKPEWKQPILSEQWDRRNANVSTFTGALTINDFRQSDEGWYRCNMVGKSPALVELKHFGSYGVCPFFSLSTKFMHGYIIAPHIYLPDVMSNLYHSFNEGFAMLTFVAFNPHPVISADLHGPPARSRRPGTMILNALNFYYSLRKKNSSY